MKSSILDVWLGSEYITASFFAGTFYMVLGKKVYRKKLGEISNEFLQMFSENSSNIIVFTKKKYLGITKSICEFAQ